MNLRAYTIRAVGLDPEPRSLLRPVDTKTRALRRAAQRAGVHVSTIEIGTDWTNQQTTPADDVRAMNEERKDSDR